MSKTPEQMAEEFAEHFAGERRKTIAKKSWWTGYQAAKDETNLPTSAKWISVKERLPEVGKEILWYHEPGEEFAIGLLHDGVEKPFFTHWMPLPEAPKGEK